MKKLILFVGLSLLMAGTLFAQTYEQKLREMEDRVKNKLDQQQKRVENEFADQLRRIWIEAELYQGLERPPVPKPLNPKVFDPAISFKDDEGEQIKYVPAPIDQPDPDDPFDTRPNVPDVPEVPDTPDPDPDPEQRLPEDELNPKLPERAEAPEPAPASPLMENQIASLNKEIYTDYFGKDLAVRYDSRMVFSPVNYLNENQIADLWLQLDGSSYEPFLYQLNRHAARMQLNDWGYCQLVNRMAHKLFPRDKNSRTLFNWFCLSKTGYIATVCYDRDELFLMLPSKHILYGKTYLKGKNGLKFYVIDLDGRDPNLSRVRIFDHKYPQASRKLDFSIERAPGLEMEPLKKKLNFEYKGKGYDIPVTINKNLLRFYGNYPFMDLEIYMKAPLSEEAQRSMLPALNKAISGMSEKEAANYLLRFVQTAFKYKTDQDQFGRERYLFAEETLYFPYCDCEDRSVLYAYLVRELLGLDTIGLIFPGHANTAVKFNDQSADGDYITYRGSKYVICDPTYINADIGMCLPEYKNKEAKIVRY